MALQVVGKYITLCVQNKEKDNVITHMMLCQRAEGMYEQKAQRNHLHDYILSIAYYCNMWACCT